MTTGTGNSAPAAAVNTAASASVVDSLKSGDLPDATGGGESSVDNNASSQGDSEVDWLAESAGEDGEGGQGDKAPVAAPAAKPAAEPAPKPAAAPAPAPAAAQPAAAPAAAAPAAQPPATDPNKAAAAPAAAEPPKPAAPAGETAEQKVAREKAELEAQQKLEGELLNFYKIPEDLAAKLPTEPEVVLPQLFAKAHQAMARSMQFLMAQQLPHYITAVSGMQAAETKAKNTFYDAWPQLKPYEQQVLQAGALYRQMNPTATPEVALKAIGEIVCRSLNIPVEAAAAVSAGGAVAAPAPAQKPAPAAAVQPAGASGSRGAAAPAAGNEFEAMHDEDFGTTT